MSFCFSLFLLYTKIMPGSKPKISEAVSVAAHQLKTPISVLRGYLEALISGDPGEINEKQKEYLSDSLENVKRMTKIVSDILDISRVEEGRYQIKIEKISLEKLTKEVIEGLALWAKAANAEISFVPGDSSFPLALSDSLRAREVIENLVSNALKFKGHGPGKIEINIKKQKNHLLFSCKDNGIGIAKEDFKKVFSKFYRSEKALRLDPSGTGVGLYINKAVIFLSGGKIWFKKNNGPGMTFFFTLPIAK